MDEHIDKLKVILITGSIVGLFDSLYLAWMKISNNPRMCIIGSGDCFSVNTSKYSQVFGIPVAILGAAAYLTLLLILFSENKTAFIEENAGLFLFGITLTGTLFSAYLTYIEVFVLRTICPFCVISAITMLFLLAISIIRLIKYHPENKT